MVQIFRLGRKSLKDTGITRQRGFNKKELHYGKCRIECFETKSWFNLASVASANQSVMSLQLCGTSTINELLENLCKELNKINIYSQEIMRR